MTAPAERAVPYAQSADHHDGRVLDVYRPLDDRHDLPVVLLWHGSGPNERDALAGLARAVARRGCLCLVPDWQSDDFTRGRRDLLESLSFTQSRSGEWGGDGGRITLAGWSLGANAAADVMLHPGVVDGWRPRALVGIAGAYDRSPITDSPLAAGRTGDTGVPCVLIHGTKDSIVPVQRSRDSHRALQEWGWRSVLREVDTDHAGVIGARYDPTSSRCVPERTSEVVDPVAAWISACA